MEIGKKAVVAMVLAFVLGVTIPVSAALYFWQTEPQQIQSGIVLTTIPEAEMGLGIYWDAGCTQNVTTIDFGEMVTPGEGGKMLGKTMYIRNEGNVTHTVYWNSTLSSVTTEITDSWLIPGMPSVPLNGTAIAVGATLGTNYYIEIQPYATVGTYNWTVTVWAEYEY